MKKETINIAILGLGNIGGGVYELLNEKKTMYKKRYGVDLTIYAVAERNTDVLQQLQVPQEKVTTQVEALLEDPELDLVVELIGGDTIAKEWSLKALAHGKTVVTANKAMLAKFGHELYSTAEEHNADLFFEAAVGGGIPLIKSLREGLAANNIESIYGILNGTCNYVLSRMQTEGLDFNTVIKEAQQAGFAEADPTLDIEGWDTAHKLVILAQIASGAPVSMEQVAVEGITRVDPADIQHAVSLGYTIKLLGIYQQTPEGITLRVGPTLVPVDHLLGKVDDAYNAALIQGDYVGQTLCYGLGAGRYPTASAVVADVLEAAINIKETFKNRFSMVRREAVPDILSDDKINSSFYLRMELVDKTGSLEQVTAKIAELNISVESFIQPDSGTEGAPAEVVIITKPCRYHDIMLLRDHLLDLDIVSGNIQVMFVANLD